MSTQSVFMSSAFAMRTALLSGPMYPTLALRGHLSMRNHVRKGENWDRVMIHNLDKAFICEARRQSFVTFVIAVSVL